MGHLPPLFTRLVLLLTTLLSFTSAEPASASQSIGGGLAFAVNVPSNSSDALFLNFRLPARSVSWGAFGFGDGMSGALIFVAYQNEAGNGITVSPRLGTGHVMPEHTTDVTFTDMGSQIANDSFIVRGMCENCRRWSGGNIDTSASAQPMIWGSGRAGSLRSDDLDATIALHQAKGRFSIDMRSAEGEPGVPQFQLEDTRTSNDGPPVGDSGRPRFFDKSAMIIAHAVLMIGAFLILFPAGYAVLRLLDKVLIHAGVQTLAALVVIIATSLGIAASKQQQISPNINAPHQIMGLIALILVVAALVVGAAGHAIYRKTGAPAKFMIVHRILGPFSVGLGLVNAVVGFRFAGHYRPIIGFVILTILIFTGITALILLKRRRAMRKQAMNTPAAMNFREGGYGGGAAPPAYGSPPPGHMPIPLQTYQPSQAPVYR
ncbi:uncharacterized protein HMPREF1541_07142 [Cyphellophora europaea CBS 101466]|uniref:DOMON domain-containing protein n=1 Tax=Cyphellophora europaea (strain CBS 101466) TaxID=1220924 RepID=W2RMH2_CYPE1|nr:uncharacterized protein HMPREF1541_07142 [Cyphellophora europaea CBS 101466]ETN37520.1 hypothetical protein HMPREF1541_07142 [Cyphellophora europaea CBS 101466]